MVGGGFRGNFKELPFYQCWSFISQWSTLKDPSAKHSCDPTTLWPRIFSQAQTFRYGTWSTGNKASVLHTSLYPLDHICIWILSRFHTKRDEYRKEEGEGERKRRRRKRIERVDKGHSENFAKRKKIIKGVNEKVQAGCDFQVILTQLTAFGRWRG